MAGFQNDAKGNEIVYCDNVDFSGNVVRNAIITANGQILIGSATGQAIRAGFLTPAAGITITNGPGTITIGLTGGGVAVEHLTGTTGGQLNPDASNNFNLLAGTVAAGTTPVAIAGAGSTLTTNIQISQAIAATDATKIGLAAFNSAQFSVDANGFVTSNGAGFVWSDVSGAVNASVNHGYFVTGTCTSTLPSAPSQGDTIKYIVDHASQLLTIQASAGKVIRLGNTATAAAGTAVSTLQGDAIELVYRSSDQAWLALGSIGQWNLT